MNFSEGGAIWGKADWVSLISSISKKRAPGIWPASYSARASRFISGKYQDASKIRRSGSDRWAASHSVETRVLGSSVIANSKARLGQGELQKDLAQIGDQAKGA